MEALLGAMLRAFVSEHDLGRVAVGEVGVYTRRNPDTVRGIDVIFISHQRLAQAAPEGYLDVAPELAVEVVSPSDRWSEVMDKLAEYFAVGVLMVWLVDPRKRQIHVSHRTASVTGGRCAGWRRRFTRIQHTGRRPVSSRIIAASSIRRPTRGERLYPCTESIRDGVAAMNLCPLSYYGCFSDKRMQNEFIQGQFEMPPVYQYLWGPTEFLGTGTLKDYDCTGRLHEIRTPTLLTCGRYDEITPASTTWYQSLIPHSEMVVFEQSAHMPHLEEPEQYRRVIRTFLRHLES
jgi:pimeloyl-ACP methyl ester carboxylesterase